MKVLVNYSDNIKLGKFSLKKTYQEVEKDRKNWRMERNSSVIRERKWGIKEQIRTQWKGKNKEQTITIMDERNLRGE